MSMPSSVKYALMGKETTQGTAVTPTKDAGLDYDEVGNSVEKELLSNVGVGRISALTVKPVMVDPKITLNGDFQHGRILEYVIGEVAHAETTGDWKHTFTESLTHPSATLLTVNNFGSDSAIITDGCIVDSCEISFALKQNLKVKSSWKGMHAEPTTSLGTKVLSSLEPFPHSLVHISVDGTEAGECQSASISMTITVADAGGAGTDEYVQRKAVSIKYEFTAVLGFSDSTYQTLMLDPDSFDFLINAHNGITLGSGRRELYFELENCQGSMSEITSTESLTFVEIKGEGTLKSCFSVDNISDSSW